MKKLIELALMLVLAVSAVAAGPGYNLVWDENPVEDGVTNYVVYVSTHETNYHGSASIVGTFTNYNAGAVTGMVFRWEGVTNTTVLTNFQTYTLPWNVTNAPGLLYFAVTAQNTVAESLYSNIAIGTNAPSRVKGFRVIHINSGVPEIGFSQVPASFKIEKASDVDGPWEQAMVADIDTNMIPSDISWAINPKIRMAFWRLVKNE